MLKFNEYLGWDTRICNEFGNLNIINGPEIKLILQGNKIQSKSINITMNYIA